MRPSREQEFGWVLHLTQSVLFHFKDADFVGRAKTVFDRANDAIGLLALAFEIQHGINHVLKHLRTGNSPLFVDMANQQNRNTVSLSAVDQCHGVFADLGHTPWGGGQSVTVKGLDRVDDQHIGLDGINLVHDAFKTGFGQNVEVLPVHTEPLRPQFQLSARLLARNVQNTLGLTQHVGHLHQQG